MREVSEGRAFIREVILENFMSYEYGRITFKPGLNVIVGPNGAGKSTILIGISVALGQSFTERAKKLSDLVRRGKEIARVTLVLDNSPVNGKRPLPYKKDTVLLSRYIRKDGSYWFEIDYKEVSKIEVVETLRKLGLNPENLLIIMPQGFIDKFIVMSPEEKLRMVEEAVGIASIRENLKEAKERLENILKDEEEYQSLLEKATESMEKWREQYERLIEYRRLKKRLEEVRVEKAWALVDKLEKTLFNLKEKRGKLETELRRLELRSLDEEREYESVMDKLNVTVNQLIEDLGPIQEMARKIGYLSASSSTSEEEEKKLSRKLSDFSRKLSSIPEVAELLAIMKGKLEVTKYRINQIKSDMRKLGREIREVEEELERERESAERIGKRPSEVRSLTEVEDEEKAILAQLRAIGAVAEEAEKAYLDLKSKIEEYRAKLERVKENKRATLKEIAERSEEWRAVIKGLLKSIDREFQAILSTLNTHGHVELINEEEPDKAGLVLKVGAKGTPLVTLDAYTQSGGEKSSTVMAFLLATQKHVLSPFRAVDEFDVHMDPVNRELFFKAIHSYFKEEKDVQYIVISPGFPPFFDPDVHYIMVQKTVRGSELKVVSREAR